MEANDILKYDIRDYDDIYSLLDKLIEEEIAYSLDYYTLDKDTKEGGYYIFIRRADAPDFESYAIYTTPSCKLVGSRVEPNEMMIEQLLDNLARKEAEIDSLNEEITNIKLTIDAAIGTLRGV